MEWKGFKSMLSSLQLYTLLSLSLSGIYRLALVFYLLGLILSEFFFLFLILSLSKKSLGCGRTQASLTSNTIHKLVIHSSIRIIHPFKHPLSSFLVLNFAYTIKRLSFVSILSWSILPHSLPPPRATSIPPPPHWIRAQCRSTPSATPHTSPVEIPCTHPNCQYVPLFKFPLINPIKLTIGYQTKNSRWTAQKIFCRTFSCATATPCTSPVHWGRRTRLGRSWAMSRCAVSPYLCPESPFPSLHAYTPFIT